MAKQEHFGIILISQPNIAMVLEVHWSSMTHTTHMLSCMMLTMVCYFIFIADLNLTYFLESTVITLSDW
jgi:hypothetical protein